MIALTSSIRPASLLTVSVVLYTRGSTGASAAMITLSPTVISRENAIRRRSSSTASSSSPAPRRWPTMMEIVLPTAKKTQKNRLETVEAMLPAETASSPRTE